MVIKNVAPTADWILLKFKKEEEKVIKTKAGIILPDGSTSSKNKVSNGGGLLYVEKIGPDAKVGFKPGDCVIANDYDLQWFGDENNSYALCQPKSVKAVIEVE